MTDSIPTGFAPWRPSSPFMEHLSELGALYKRDADCVLALRVGQAHTNMHAIAHGGLLATLADSALGHTIAEQAQASVVTVQMSVEYLNPVKPGDWLEAHVRIDKQGRRLIYATCLLQVAGRVMLKANAVFAVRAAPRAGFGRLRPERPERPAGWWLTWPIGGVRRGQQGRG